MTGLERVKELFDALYLYVQRAYLMPLDRYHLVGEVLPHIRLRTSRKG